MTFLPSVAASARTRAAPSIDTTLTDAPGVGLERAFHRFLARRRACAREKLLGILGLLEHAVAEQRNARRPGRTVFSRMLGAELGAERDQLSHVGDRLDRAGCREPHEPLRVQIVTEQEDRVAVARREEPRTSVVDEVALVDRLDGDREARVREPGEDRLAVAGAARTERIAPERALALGLERDLLS